MKRILLWHSPLTDNVYASKSTPTGKQSGEKENVTNEFLGAIISRWENKTETITSGDSKWQITVKKQS